MTSAVAPAPSIVWQRALLALALTELILLGAYLETARSMVEIWWRSETFNHAFLVPPITLWLIWEKRLALRRTEVRPALWVVMPMVLVGLVWLLGELAAVNVLTQFAFVALLVLAVPLTLGLTVARQIVFPLMFLFFAVPFGEFVMPALMDWTAKFTVIGLRASGIPVFQEGLHFVIPSGRWSVIEACSGVRYLVASIVVGSLYAYINYQSVKRRLIFVGFSVVVPLAANWVRAYLTVMLGHFSNNQLATGVDHLLYGWLFFGIVITLMFAIGMRWREPERESAPEAARPPPAAPTMRPIAGAAVLAALIGISPPLAINLMNDHHAGTLEADQRSPVLMPERLVRNGWEVAPAPPAIWEPAFVNPSAVLHAGLQRGEQQVGVYLAYYRQQDKSRKLIGSQNQVVESDDKHWAMIERSQQTGRWAEHAEQAWLAATLRHDSLRVGAEALRFKLRYAYWIDGRIITSEPLGKWLLAWSRLRGQRDDSAAVFVYAVEPGADAALDAYLASAGAALQDLLETAVTPAPTASRAYTSTP